MGIRHEHTRNRRRGYKKQKSSNAVGVAGLVMVAGCDARGKQSIEHESRRFLRYALHSSLELQWMGKRYNHLRLVLMTIYMG